MSDPNGRSRGSAPHRGRGAVGEGLDLRCAELRGVTPGGVDQRSISQGEVQRAAQRQAGQESVQDARGEHITRADPVHDLQVAVFPAPAEALADADESAQVVPVPLMDGAFGAGDEF